MNGSVITPMNWFIALNVVCCDPVAVSPEICVSPAGVSPPNTIGMPPVVLKKLIDGVADVLLVGVEPGPGGGTKVKRQIEKGVVGIVAQARRESAGQIGVDGRLNVLPPTPPVAFRMVYCLAT